MRHATYKPINSWTVLLSVLFFISCQKADEEKPLSTISAESKEIVLKKQTKKYSSEVAQQWLDLQLRILRIEGETPSTPAPNPYSLHGNRQFAYMGVALYESILPGMPSYQSLHGQLTDMPKMPETEKGKSYYWPAAANAALAFLTKNYYTNASSSHQQAMTDLENSLNSNYQQQTDAAAFARSVEFGKEVAKRIFEWSKTDGSLTNYPLFSLPSGLGIWSNTAPNPTGMAAPYWGKNRLFVPGSLDHSSSPLPPSFSTDPASAYYAMVKEVYDISQNLTEKQKATALYFRDNPGYQAGTNYQFTFHQVMQKENPDLAEYAIAQVKTGIAMADAQIGCWKIKYDLLQERPCRMIRDVLGHSTWNPLISTPPHPDFPSGHSQTGGSFSAVMTNLLGPAYRLTLHTYDHLGMAPRSYQSFDDMVDDIAMSRVYAGIHYRYSCVEGKKQGMKIAQNILNKLKFK